MKIVKTMKTVKRNLFFSAGVAACALFAAGCSNDENMPGGNDNDGRVALQVSSGIQTRAVDDQWEDGDAIGIFALMPGTTDVATDNTSGLEQRNRQYSTGKSALGTFDPASEAATIYLPVDGTTRDFIAYYPYQDEMTDNTYTINLKNQQDQSDIDFMMAEKVQNIGKANPAVQFRFLHKLSKVRLNIATGNGFKGDNSELEGMEITLTGQQTTADFDVLTGDEVSIVKGSEGIVLLTEADGRTSEGIVMPSNDYDGMQFEFRVKGHAQPYVWKLSKSDNAQKFEPGKDYIYNITIHRTAIEVTATIKDWEPGNEGGENGDAE